MWVFHPRTRINYIAVDNKVLHLGDKVQVANLVPVMKSLYYALVLGGSCPIPLVVDEDEPLVQQTCHFVYWSREFGFQKVARPWILTISGRVNNELSLENSGDNHFCILVILGIS
ncbi:hypothetical protein PanWU01x14_361480 [Parasponia andersonii]|uniref:Uncharacterized protein n=1 Tax=Parasponia andersonii TaxID=3476 RepID=A0A2P5A7B3_PARAD|nr:hypothetical protein PanWU01x14_361480 [Parasponia andersonii]